MDFVCQKSPKKADFFINAVLHVFILLIIISAFFFLYVSQLASEKFKDELADVINDNLNPALSKADKDGKIKAILAQIDLERMTEYYDVESQETKTQNGWLLKTTIMIVVVLLLILVVTIAIIKIFCRRIPFGRILQENIILFTLVGSVEIAFFMFIARKFIPTKPSLVMQSFLDSIRKNL